LVEGTLDLTFASMGTPIPSQLAHEVLLEDRYVLLVPPGSPYRGRADVTLQELDGLEVYGVTGGLAVSWAIGYHILSFIPITVIGLYYFARLGLHFSDFKTQPNEAR